MVTLILESGSSKRKCKLYDVLYVPRFTYNSLSVSKAVQNGVSFTISDLHYIIKDVNQRLIMVANKSFIMWCRVSQRIMCITSQNRYRKQDAR